MATKPITSDARIIAENIVIFPSAFLSASPNTEEMLVG